MSCISRFLIGKSRLFRVVLLFCCAGESFATAGDDGVFYIDRGEGKRVRVERIIRTGDPAPGIPGGVITVLVQSQINNAGQILFAATVEGPGEDDENIVVYLRQVDGTVNFVAQTGIAAPGLPPGVVFSPLSPFGQFFQYSLSDSGHVLLFARVSGPGISHNVNDKCAWLGVGTDLSLVAQSGMSAPGCEAGVTIWGGFGLSGPVNAFGEALIYGWLEGTDLGTPGFRDAAVWYSDGGPMELILRTGDPASGPGIPPDSVFDGFDSNAITEVGTMVFRTALAGPGIDDSNDTGIWGGPFGEYQPYIHEGQPAPGLPGETIGVVGSLPETNAFGDLVEITWLSDGASGEAETTLYTGTLDFMTLIGMEGDAPKGSPSEVYYSVFGSTTINNSNQIIVGNMWLTGAGTTVDFNQLILYGPYQNPRPLIWEQDPAPGFHGGERILLQLGTGTSCIMAMNSEDDLLLKAFLTGPGIDATNNEAVWAWHGFRSSWTLFSRAGEKWDGRTVAVQPVGQPMFWWDTGGSDSKRQSINDHGTTVLLMPFTAGDKGLYMIDVIFPSHFDGDGDGDVDLLDFAGFQICFSGAGIQTSSECMDVFDGDGDGDVDLIDFASFQLNFTGAG